MSFIYLDNNATTQLDSAVLEAMLPYLKDLYGNPSSMQHRLGREAHKAVETARQRVAQAIGAKEQEIYFNSGATEGINTVLRGVAQSYATKGKHIITCKTEHKAVLTTCELLERQGMEITYLDVNNNGELSLDQLKNAIRPDTILVCLMSANNETGVLHPISDIAHICQERDVLYFCDVTQSIGKHPLHVQQLPVDLLVFSAHKLHGPKGTGVLYIRRRTAKPIQIPPLISGGKQENNLRGGTLNVPNIVGCGQALANIETKPQIKALRDMLEKQIISRVPETFVNGQIEKRLDNTSNITFRHLKSTEIMTALPDIALSSGSACVSGLSDPSHVLKAMGLSNEDAHSSIRFSLSKYTTEQDVADVVQQIEQVVTRLREASPIWKLFKDGLIP
ncbi:cysteine desulfurase family protein [Sphingobacterium wenxiniae]|uniref:cysteine desulfurase n=1 Tax=Sphingobacterium wenxiniae TaxID=683125 RepID=A0A1I6NX05_9SPHI|nr:cysteine desulfurase family protein [Sphingobacterium wenxiniae]SFS32434.1 cysteine desulfurase IscS [Sphingobacterium wenxiniae]